MRYLLFFFLFFIIPAYPITWSSAVPISSSFASDPSVGIDDSGNAVAAWVENGFITASIFTKSTGTWAASETLSASAEGAFPQVSVNGSGQAVVVWQEGAGGMRVINARTRSSLISGSWSSVTTLQAMADSVNAQVSIGSSGNAMAIWERGGAIEAKAFIGGAWSGTINTIGSGTTPQVGVDSAGNAVAVWDDGGTIKSDVFNVSTTMWSGSVTSLSPAGSTQPQVSVNSSGYTVAVWVNAGGDVGFRTRDTIIGGTWSSASTISGSAAASFPQIAVSTSGNAVAVWIENPMVGVFEIQAAMLPFGGSWSAVTTLATLGSPVTTPKVDVDASGNAIALWSGPIMGSNVIQASALTFGNGWSSPTTLATPDAVGNVDVAVNETGDAVAVWEQNVGGTQVIDAATATGLSISPPTNVSGVQISHRFVRQEDLINVLTWVSPGGSAVAFRIYRGDASNFIGETTQTKFEDHQRVPHETVTYFITAVSSSGSESAAATITVSPK